jgi:hypothetical protein
MYAHEKLNAAIYDLAVGTGSIRERLSAASDEFGPLTENDFPLDYRDRWKALNGSLRQHKDPADIDSPARVGDVPYTLDRLTDEEMSQIAMEIWNLRHALCNYMEDERERAKATASPR